MRVPYEAAERDNGICAETENSRGADVRDYASVTRSCLESSFALCIVLCTQWPGSLMSAAIELNHTLFNSRLKKLLDAWKVLVTLLQEPFC
jgi:hypothetical protein